MGTSTLIQDGKADMATLRTEACFIKVGILTVKLNAMKGVLCTTRANVVQLKIRTGFQTRNSDVQFLKPMETALMPLK